MNKSTRDVVWHGRAIILGGCAGMVVGLCANVLAWFGCIVCIIPGGFIVLGLSKIVLGRLPPIDDPYSYYLMMAMNLVTFTGAGALIGPIIYYPFRAKNLPFGDARFSPRCAKCGYSLIGNVSGLCPECGTKIEKV